ncbi:hypothetical protein NKI25_16355 [Mesorhizobium sp. M0808]|uniref:hypothetical protein n=1 Tax=Mesorhizobium sp. M0808 TaxID=2957002 RepID=UPI003337F3BC
MDWRSIALGTAGLIGAATASAHGVLMQRLIVRPIDALIGADARISAPVQRLVPPLLHFTTFNWGLSGLTLIAAALWFGDGARLVTGLFAGSSFLFGAAGALWGTRRFHPGWLLMAIALVLIVLGLGSAIHA